MTEFTGQRVNTGISILFCQSFKHSLLNPHRSGIKPSKLNTEFGICGYLLQYNVLNLGDFCDGI